MTDEIKTIIEKDQKELSGQLLPRLRLLYAMSGGSRYSGKFQNLERSGGIPEYRTDQEKNGLEWMKKRRQIIVSDVENVRKSVRRKISIRENLQQVAEELNTL